jgi:amino acid transporter
MTPSSIAGLAALIVVFACGAALLSHRFYAAYQGWWPKRPRYRTHHLPGVLGILSMLFAIVVASTLGWAYAIATLIVGPALALLYVYVLRWRIEIAPLGLLFGVLAVVIER